MAGVDYVIVGGGINGLVAASTLGKKGRKVLLVERSDRIGGCLRTEEIYHIGASTHPGPGLGGVSGFLLANALK